MNHVLFILGLHSKQFEIPTLITPGWEVSSIDENELVSLDSPIDVAIWVTSNPSISTLQSMYAKLHIRNCIVSTSSSDIETRIALLKFGIIDILDMDISIEEFQLRIDAIFKRIPGEIKQERTVRIGEYLFDYERRTLSINSETRILTTKEAELLRLLEQSRNQPVTKQKALSEIWGNDSYHNGRSMDVYIGKLRKYLQHDKTIQILNIHGSGYKLSDLT